MNWLGELVQKLIKEDDEVLDLGCGKGQSTNGLVCKRLVGVDIFKDWIREYRGEKILADVRTVEFKPNSFDYVLALDILEHLKAEEMIELLKKAERWARKIVLLYTPYRFELQNTFGNPHNQHKCLVKAENLKEMGYSVNVIDPDYNVFAFKETGKCT